MVIISLVSRFSHNILSQGKYQLLIPSISTICLHACDMMEEEILINYLIRSIGPHIPELIIDEGDFRSLVIEMVNWLHYLNYEDISCSLSVCYFLHTESFIQSDLHVIWSDLHVPFLSYGLTLTLQLEYLIVYTYGRHQHTLV